MCGDLRRRQSVWLVVVVGGRQCRVEHVKVDMQIDRTDPFAQRADQRIECTRRAAASDIGDTDLCHIRRVQISGLLI